MKFEKLIWFLVKWMLLVILVRVVWWSGGVIF